MQAFAEVLRVFVERHLIPTVVSFVLACIGFVSLPTNFLGRDKYDAMWFLIFAWAIAFLVIQLLIKVYKVLRGRIGLIKEVEYHSTHVEEQNEDAIEQVWTIVDKYSFDDKEMLKEFIKNENKPIVRNDYQMGFGLLNSQYVHVSDVILSEGKPNTALLNQDENGNFTAFMVPASKQYILRNWFYQVLKYGYEKHGRISHFE